MKTLALILSVCASIHSATFDFSTGENPTTNDGVAVTLNPDPIFAVGWIGNEFVGFGATGFWDLALGGGVIQCPAGQAAVSITAYEDVSIYRPAHLGVQSTITGTNGANQLGQWIVRTYALSTTGRIEFSHEPGNFGLIVDRITVDVVTPTPQLSIATTPAVSVSWQGQGWTLMRKSGGDWRAVGTNSPALVPADGVAIFKLQR